MEEELHYRDIFSAKYFSYLGFFSQKSIISGYVEPILGLAETAVIVEYVLLLLVFYIKANTSM